MGSSNSGKTELICRLLEWFSAQGLRAAVLKHSHHQHLGDDGKDTWRYRQAG
ncbi:MAG: molybdopterin-guanine dinucleotide biosynthesis protein MobB, partial [Deltaproteobacteria bacterium]|nr:molybdopterin-guanine dinucleotide biosynthesis protein MobB [Deltaproteobacteria bacterium]